MSRIEFLNHKVKQSFKIFNGCTDFFRRIWFWAGILTEEGVRMIVLPWDVWLGISLMTLSAGMITYKGYDHFFSSFLSIDDALELMRRQMNDYQAFNWQRVNISKKDYYEGLMRSAMDEESELPLYGRLVFLNKPSTSTTKIPKESKPPYGNLTYDRLYTSIINKHKEPVYQDLRLKRKDLQRWIKNNTTVTS